MLPARAPRATWLVAPIVAPLIERLSRGPLGWCNATYGSLRIMAWVDTGYTFGDGSIPRWVRREYKRGKLRHVQCRPGWKFHRTGMQTTKGTTINRYPNEGERREALWRAKQLRREQRKKQRQALELERQRRAAEARAARRARAQVQRGQGERMVRVAPELPSLEQLAALTGAIAKGTIASTQIAPATSPTSPAAEDLRARVAEQLERARAFAATLPPELRGPPVDVDDDAPPDE